MVERVSELLRSLRDEGPSTRSQLAERIGASRGTIASDVAGLVAAGLVEDAPGMSGSGGRPSALLQIDAGLRFLAVSLGESRARVALLGGGLTILRGLSLSTSDVEEPAVWDWAVEAATTVLREEGGDRPAGIGVVRAPGHDRTVREAGAARDAAGLDPIAGELTALLGGEGVVDVAPVHAMALGERHSGDARGSRDFLALRLGYGVTCAAVVDGRLLRGGTGRAGEIGHHKIDDFGPVCTCGNSGCLDAFAGTSALLEQARLEGESGRSPFLAAALARRGDEGLVVADLVEAVAAGDRAVVQLTRDVGRRVGDAVSAMIGLVNPDTVVLGGPLAALGDNLVAEVRAAIHRRAPAALTHGVGVELSALGERAVLVGAAHAASDALFAGPPSLG